MEESFVRTYLVKNVPVKEATFGSVYLFKNVPMEEATLTAHVKWPAV